MATTSVQVTAVQQYLTFAVAEEEYAIDLLRIREILAYVPLTRVPRAPEFVAGVMNLRGIVVPVIDLRVKLGLSPTSITGRTCTIVLEVQHDEGTTLMGVFADDVRRVIEIGANEIAPAPTFGTQIDFSFLLGMGDVGDHFALILNVDKVLTTLELIAASAAARDAAGLSA